ncbi:unnamed protein product [Rangifer tarandus platyrhynchus]|uniref:Uncharacterized protein n=1 Tax=Rangifer tarandus platyrhynchus TaxID=3082113 RepID=A0ABN8ZQD3_RANTA|nr:unnamed protein product [Rangifer tarandus platyrhynchus]
MNQRVRSFYVRTDGVHILLSRRGGLLSEHEGWRPWPRRGRGCQGRSSLKHLPGKHPDTQDEDEGVVPRDGKRTQAAKGPCAGSWVLSRPHLPYLAAKNQRQQSSLVSPTEPPDCLSAGLWVVTRPVRISGKVKGKPPSSARGREHTFQQNKALASNLGSEAASRAGYSCPGGRLGTHDGPEPIPI